MEHPLFAVCAPGLEPLTAAELRALGHAEAAEEPGGVAFRGGLAELYRANLCLRTATRVLLRLGEFHARDFDQLRKRASRLAFEGCLVPGRMLRVSASSSRSRLVHSGAVAERVELAIADRLGAAPLLAARRTSPAEDGEPDVQLVLVRVVHDRCTISVDGSGALLHQRGWRKASGKAPLRETLAAALVLASDWDGRVPLADPFCGAGTIVIEAATLARRLAPGRGRRFACLDWPSFDAALWSRVQKHAADGEVDRVPAPIRGADRDAGAIDAARANADAAGVAADVELARAAISSFEPPPGTGVIASNPPYGVRLRGGDLRDLYARFGSVLARRCPGWRVAILCSDRKLVRASGLPLEPRARWRNGGLAIELFAGTVPGGVR
jgi:putative N6-adenine-specific DNA methylase